MKKKMRNALVPAIDLYNPDNLLFAYHAMSDEIPEKDDDILDTFRSSVSCKLSSPYAIPTDPQKAIHANRRKNTVNKKRKNAKFLKAIGYKTDNMDAREMQKAINKHTHMDKLFLSGNKAKASCKRMSSDISSNEQRLISQTYKQLAEQVAAVEAEMLDAENEANRYKQLKANLSDRITKLDQCLSVYDDAPLYWETLLMWDSRKQLTDQQNEAEKQWYYYHLLHDELICQWTTLKTEKAAIEDLYALIKTDIRF